METFTGAPVGSKPKNQASLERMSRMQVPYAATSREPPAYWTPQVYGCGVLDGLTFRVSTCQSELGSGCGPFSDLQLCHSLAFMRRNMRFMRPTLFLRPSQSVMQGRWCKAAAGWHLGGVLYCFLLLLDTDVLDATGPAHFRAFQACCEHPTSCQRSFGPWCAEPPAATSALSELFS